MMKSLITFLACLCLATLLPACSRSNNVLLGRVEAKVGEHNVVVTDCYRTSVPAPVKVEASASGGRESYRYAPCRDSDILIRDEDLTVNGTSYGRLKPNDAVTVDHGKVLINNRETQAVASR